jgi:hypothetical protein
MSVSLPRHANDGGRLLERIEPLHVEALYQLARIAALRGELAEAYSWLDRAVGAGYWDARTVREDEAFTALRQEERFRSVARAAWANGCIARLERPEREAFQKRAQIVAQAYDFLPERYFVVYRAEAGRGEARRRRACEMTLAPRNAADGARRTHDEAGPEGRPRSRTDESAPGH